MYQVRISENAEEDLRGFLAFLRAEHPSSTRAAEWFDHLRRGLQSLRQLPSRCSRAPEDEHFPATIRQLLVEPCRVLFMVDEERELVWILHVRHQKRRSLDPGDVGL